MADETPEKSLDSHHETLYGTKQNPQTGLVSVVGQLAKDLGPFIAVMKGAKVPLAIIGAGLLSALTGGLVNLIRKWLGGG